MPTSFVTYKGYGYWTRDNFLAEWIRTFLDELKYLPTIEQWQQSLQEHWLLQIEIDGGCMTLGLDEYISDNARRDALLSLAKLALPHSTESARRTGELFIDLLSGRLKTIQSSPIDYL